MIWIKRIAPILLIAVIWLSYNWYTERELKQFTDRTGQYAEVTALVWLKAAEYRDSSEVFIAYRDSLLASYNLNGDSVMHYVDQFESEPEKLGPLVVQIKNIVDSLILEAQPKDPTDTFDYE